MTLSIPATGRGFTFRWYPRWQVWRRTVGGAQTVGLDAAIGVVHLRIFPLDGADEAGGILHLPIVASQVGPAVVSVFDIPEGVPAQSTVAIERWRAEHRAGRAGAFSVGIAAAVQLVMEVVGSESLLIETAYPVRSADGQFSSVHASVI